MDLTIGALIFLIVVWVVGVRRCRDLDEDDPFERQKE